jgi:hypothetical protein
MAISERGEPDSVTKPVTTGQEFPMVLEITTFWRQSFQRNVEIV